MSTKHILVQNHYFPKPGKEEEVYEWRLHASEVRVKLGRAKGRVLKKLKGTNAPHVIWECEYPSMEACKESTSSLKQSAEFKKVQEHMRTLISRFERSVWEIDN
jgi:hypothetical protein